MGFESIVRAFESKEKRAERERNEKIAERAALESARRDMAGFIANLEEQAETVKRAEERAIAKAIEAGEKDYTEVYNDMLDYANDMAEFYADIDSFRFQIEAVAITADVMQGFSDFPAFMRNLNGLLGRCPDFNAMSYDMDNLRGMMAEMRNSFREFRKPFGKNKKTDSRADDVYKRIYSNNVDAAAADAARQRRYDEIKRKVDAQIEARVGTVGVANANNNAGVTAADVARLDDITNMFDDVRGGN